VGKAPYYKAVDFLRSASFRDIPEYLKEWDWAFPALKSQFGDGQEKAIEFISLFELEIGEVIRKLEWFFSVDLHNNVWEIKERIINLTDGNQELTGDQQNWLNKTISDFIGYEIKVKTIDFGEKIELVINENFSNQEIKVGNEHISDGLLRIVAFAALAINERKAGFFLSPYPSEDNYFIEHGIQKNDGIILKRILTFCGRKKTGELAAVRCSRQPA
jgi:FtsZ-binding cell division protein ZapB